jgi:hypothetical protein
MQYSLKELHLNPQVVSFPLYIKMREECLILSLAVNIREPERLHLDREPMINDLLRRQREQGRIVVLA